MGVEKRATDTVAEAVVKEAKANQVRQRRKEASSQGNIAWPEDTTTKKPSKAPQSNAWQTKGGKDAAKKLAKQIKEQTDVAVLRA